MSEEWQQEIVTLMTELGEWQSGKARASRLFAIQEHSRAIRGLREKIARGEMFRVTNEKGTLALPRVYHEAIQERIDAIRWCRKHLDPKVEIARIQDEIAARYQWIQLMEC